MRQRSIGQIILENFSFSMSIFNTHDEWCKFGKVNWVSKLLQNSANIWACLIISNYFVTAASAQAEVATQKIYYHLQIPAQKESGPGSKIIMGIGII